MSKRITPEIIEDAIVWLEKHPYCCHALPSAISGHSYTTTKCTDEDVWVAEKFLRPLFERDNITTQGGWESCIYPHDKLAFTRKEWLTKIAQELREGKISS